MRSKTPDAVHGDHALLVCIGQHPVKARDRGNSSRSCRGRSCLQTPLLEPSYELSDVPLAGCVCLECTHDMRSSFCVDHDGSDLPTVSGLSWNIAVADRCVTRHAATHGFLTHPSYDFLRKVAGVEFGKRSHDHGQQYAVRSCVDPLCACCQFISCWAGIEKPSLRLPLSTWAQWLHRETYETVDSGEDTE